MDKQKIVDANQMYVEYFNSGNIAFHEGTYSLNIKDDKGNIIGSDNGKYLVIWEKQSDGEWLMKKDIWNTSLPLNN